MFAHVAVENVPDRLFTYVIPEGLDVRVGQRVVVPWRQVMRQGYAVAVGDTAPCLRKREKPSEETPEQGDLFGTPSGPKGIRAVAAVDDPLPYFSETTIRLLQWMAAYYSVGFTLALRSALPAPVREGHAGARELYIVTPVVPPPADPKRLPSRRRQLYEDIVRVDGGRLAQLCEEFATTPATVRKLAADGFVTCEKTVVSRSPMAGRRVLPDRPRPLTAEQASALKTILDADRAVLLFGVTGSGKTEVYMQAIAHVLEQGRGAIVLVPEISLTPQTVTRFAARFGSRVAVLHSALSDGERHDEWHRIRRGEAMVVVGPRSAVFAPLAKVGLIVVDEEHDSGYKQDESPRYSARDVAVVRARLEHAICVLGSATPSLESWRNATILGKYRLAEMAHRVGHSTLPSVMTVDMREECKPGALVPIFSQPLIEALKTRIERGEQSILFLNRRGYAPSVQCPKCGYVMTCERCSAKMTYHIKDDTVRCHLCGAWSRPPMACPQCHAPGFRYTGFGTQRVEAALHAILPRARVIRMDADATARRHSHDELLSSFRAKEADILLGTQMIAKGLDFPNVTLVGILAADRSLNIAYDFRAAERTFQLIAQVSGRAGRGELPGQVIVQTFSPEHPAIALAAACDYRAFVAQELAEREAAGLPPFRKLGCVTVTSPDPGLAERTARRAEVGFRVCRGIDVSPASPAPLERKEDLYRWQLLLRAESSQAISAACEHVLPRAERLRKDLRVLVDIDAVFLS